MNGVQCSFLVRGKGREGEGREGGREGGRGGGGGGVGGGGWEGGYCLEGNNIKRMEHCPYI